MPYINVGDDGQPNGRYGEDIAELSKRLNATMRFLSSFDGKYGALYEETENWNGLIKVGQSIFLCL